MDRDNIDELLTGDELTAEAILVALGLFSIGVVLAVAVMAGRPALEGLGASAALTSRAAFSVGDQIMVDDVVGEVLEITNYSTVMRLPDARRVHVSNVEMLTKTVTVFTVERERRSSVEVKVALDTDIDHADHVIRQALDDVGSISRVGPTRARGLDEGVELSFRFWHPSDIQAGDEAIDGAVRVIKTSLERNAIRLARSSILRIDDEATEP